MKKLLILLLFPTLLFAQHGGKATLIQTSTTPLPTCTPAVAGQQEPIIWDITNQLLKTCGPATNQWSAVGGGGGGGSGTVTNFTAVGTTTPFFTTLVTAPTTTPQLAFTLVNQVANCVLAGPTSGGAAAPTCRALVAADILPINLASTSNGGITGNLGVTHLNSGISAGPTTFWAGDGSWKVPGGVGSVSLVSTTGPLSGGPITTTGTLSCPTCVTSAASLTSNALMVGGGSQASAVLASLGTTTTVLHGNAAGLPTFGAVNIGAGGDITGNLPVTNLGSGTGASGATFWAGDGTWKAPPGSGTVVQIVFNSPLSGGTITTTGTVGCATCVTSAASLTANQLQIGSGSQGTQTLGTLGTTTTVLHGNAGGAPSFGAVSLTADITGNLPVANLASGVGATSLTFWRGDGSWATPAGSGNVTTSVALTANRIVLGNAGSDLIVMASAGTGTTLLHGGSPPTYSAVNLTAGADITGNLPVANLAGGVGATNLTFWRGDGTWATPAGSAAITSLNGLTGTTQTFATGTTGTDFGISSSGTTHTFNIPSASAANRGLVTIAAQTFLGAKLFTLGTISAAASPVASTATWNNGAVTFDGLLEDVTDTASAAGSFLMRLRVGGTSQFSVNKSGATVALGGATATSFTSNGAGSGSVALTASGGGVFTLTTPAVVTSYNWAVPAADAAGFIQSNGSGTLSINTAIRQGAPTITTHFNSSGDSISANNGPAAFTVTVGTGAGTSTGVLGLPTAATGWNCFATNRTRADQIQETANTASSATLTNYGTTYAATNWTNSDILQVSCFAY